MPLAAGGWTPALLGRVVDGAHQPTPTVDDSGLASLSPTARPFHRDGPARVFTLSTIQPDFHQPALA